jgi:predicted transposase YbfD/YdcC
MPQLNTSAPSRLAAGKNTTAERLLGAASELMIERKSIEKKTGKHSHDIALGITSRTPQQASPQRVLAVNRGHWAIESVHYMIDWNYDEDRSRIRTGFGPENITRLRRFAVGILK